MNAARELKRAPSSGRRCWSSSRISALNGVLYGMLLFLMASGLTLIFSMMGVLNFAHASFYMLGAFFGFQISRWSASGRPSSSRPSWSAASGRWSSATACGTCTGTVQVAELLFTFGLAFVIEELVQIDLGQVAGRLSRAVVARFPAFTAFATNYPAYKMFDAADRDRDFRGCSSC